ncbi:MAG: 3-oxoacyl-[acyl-carrier-protein] reductase [candidate division Zixibacteria bacterium]|nr:3-oxoacyl-[acyl-carrier-protein] reductase [candidate division Zixibacteria bacterium]
MTLTGKTALITGSARGIGKAIAERLAADGAKIVISDIMADAAETTAEELRSRGVEVIAVAANVASRDDAIRLVETAVAKFSRLDIVVNNAGITRDGLMVRMSEQDWDSVINVNLKGAFLVTQAAAKLMMKQRSGRIVNISSVVGRMGNAGQTNYAASKAGLIGLTRAAAKELATRGVTVNAIAPGFIQTAMTDQMPEAARERLSEAIPMKRLGTSEDVAAAVAFLVSEDASYVTGQVIGVDGGLLMS